MSPKRVRNPEATSTASTAIVPAAEVLKWKDQPGVPVIAADPMHEDESALRIRAALKAARSEEQHGQPPEAPAIMGRWIVKPLPRPPLVAPMLQKLPADELLENDSLGG